MHQPHRRLQLLLPIAIHHHLVDFTHRGSDRVIHHTIISFTHHSSKLHPAQVHRLSLQHCNSIGQSSHSVQLLCDILQPCPHQLYRWSCPAILGLQHRQLDLVICRLVHHSTQCLRLCLRLQRDCCSLCLHRLGKLQHRCGHRLNHGLRLTLGTTMRTTMHPSSTVRVISVCGLTLIFYGCQWCFRVRIGFHWRTSQFDPMPFKLNANLRVHIRVL